MLTLNISFDDLGFVGEVTCYIFGGLCITVNKKVYIYIT